MEKFVARQNIEHYRAKLATETNEERRQILLRLLAEEEAKLVAMEKTPRRKETKFLARALPFPPVCRLKADQLFLVFRLDPAAEDASARKRQYMQPSTGIEDGEF